MPFPLALDHLLIGAPDLGSGIAWVADHLGVTPVPGGRHPGLGTHNALTGLSGTRYLEVIAPDPGGAGLAPPFAWLASFAEPAVATWAVATTDLALIASSFEEWRVPHSGLMAGSRRRPDGSLLEWQTLFPEDNEGGIIPFFISWKDPAQHPALSLPRGLELEALTFVHPEPERMLKIFAAAGLDASIEEGDAPRLSATIRGPLGVREI
ncbi:MAG TPA: VOC family protein [Thermoanaerobaculia bacterium]|nr:VOC family protein [Thermoanaerobaculia bacterium]